jgi:hypothetical protein
MKRALLIALALTVPLGAASAQVPLTTDAQLSVWSTIFKGNDITGQSDAQHIVQMPCLSPVTGANGCTDVFLGRYGVFQDRVPGNTETGAGINGNLIPYLANWGTLQFTTPTGWANMPKVDAPWNCTGNTCQVLHNIPALLPAMNTWQMTGWANSDPSAPKPAPGWSLFNAYDGAVTMFNNTVWVAFQTETNSGLYGTNSPFNGNARAASVCIGPMLDIDATHTNLAASHGIDTTRISCPVLGSHYIGDTNTYHFNGQASSWDYANWSVSAGVPLLFVYQGGLYLWWNQNASVVPNLGSNIPNYINTRGAKLVLGADNRMWVNNSGALPVATDDPILTSSIMNIVPTDITRNTKANMSGVVTDGSTYIFGFAGIGGEYNPNSPDVANGGHCYAIGNARKTAFPYGCARMTAGFSASPLGQKSDLDYALFGKRLIGSVPGKNCGTQTVGGVTQTLVMPINPIGYIGDMINNNGAHNFLGDMNNFNTNTSPTPPNGIAALPNFPPGSAALTNVGGIVQFPWNPLTWASSLLTDAVCLDGQ